MDGVEAVTHDGEIIPLGTRRSMTRWFSYVNWHDVAAYEQAGWSHPEPQVAYPRLHAHGTTMEWEGQGKPPVPVAAGIEQ